ncbi:MAG: glycoside hydrolase family 18 protein [Ignavibacteria bacterium]|nr:MAG: glycoside hydrolase family 18 protein [Ignavibacteria bacterium]
MLLLSTLINLKAQTGPWVSAYYAGWSQGQANDGLLPAQNIDYGALTHVIHFSLVPGSNGTLDYSSNSITQANSSALVQAAHAAGKKALICVGGWATDGGFLGATGAATLPTFVSNLVGFMTSRGYDGVDIDWEPLNPGDAAQYTALITALRTALDAVSPRPLLTAATAWQPSILAQVQSKFDQINIMTYDLSGAWGGWVTWHNSAIYDGGYTFPSTGGPVPSANGMVDGFTSAGIAKGKIGIGIDFYAYVWSGGSGTPAGGATEPRQSWSSAPSVQSNLPYSSMMQTYYQPQYVHWDAGAQAAYLGIDNAGSANDKFISYDDETTCQKKVQYTRDKGIGGVIIWELGGGYLPSSFPNRDRLLQARRRNPDSPAGPPVGLSGQRHNGRCDCFHTHLEQFHRRHIVPGAGLGKFRFLHDSGRSERTLHNLGCGHRPPDLHGLLLARECHQFGRHKRMVRKLRLYDRERAPSSPSARRTGPGFSRNRRHRSRHQSHARVERLFRRFVVQAAGLRKLRLFDHGRRSDRTLHNLGCGHRPPDLHGLLLARECYEFIGDKRLVGCIRFHDTRRSSSNVIGSLGGTGQVARALDQCFVVCDRRLFERRTALWRRRVRQSNPEQLGGLERAQRKLGIPGQLRSRRVQESRFRTLYFDERRLDRSSA